MLKQSLFFVSIVSTLLLASNARADDDRVFAPDSQPFGLSYGQWSVRWWEWVLSIPTSANPAADNATTGAGVFCGVGQQGPVWNLAGVFSNLSPLPVPTRTCSVPEGRAILFPVINGECSVAEGTPEAQLRSCAISQLQPVDVLQAELDGVPIGDLDDFVFQTPLFTFWLPQDNVIGVSGGPLTTHSVADGFFVMLKPLSVGNHTLHFKGGITGPGGFIIEATYHLHIVP
jgi:hypothetical protein